VIDPYVLVSLSKKERTFYSGLCMLGDLSISVSRLATGQEPY
jgi:hypothetical protein